MFSVFRMGPAASGRGLCDIDSVIQSYLFTFRKIEKSWHGENIPIIIKIENAHLSVYFSSCQTSQFFDI